MWYNVVGILDLSRLNFEKCGDYVICTFFGHNDTPKKIEPLLRSALIDLIENKKADTFYVGNHGNFDRMVRKQLKQLKLEYTHISYAVVLAYLPCKKNDYEDFSDTVYPEGFENTPPKYAIVKRNKWMIEQADYVVTYVKRTVGGAAQFKSLAEKRGKAVLNLADSYN